MTTTGGDVVVETLVGLGVDTGFTVPGESFLTVVEALRRDQNAFRLVSTRHEGGAAFAAEAYGRLTGRPAAVFVSRGPGATNAAIGLHTARQGSAPLLLFVGHVRRRSSGRESFQEVDHHQLFASLSKSVLEARDPDDLARVTRLAVEASMDGRPSPVVVVLPRDVTEAEVQGAAPPEPYTRRAVIAMDGELQAAAAAIAAARFPLILAGEMVSYEESGDALVAFAEALGAPVLSAYRQQDVFPNLDPAYAGHLEINRAAHQREAFARSDLVIAVGSRLDGITTEDYTLFGGHQRVIQIHPDEGTLVRSRPHLVVRSDTAPALAALGGQLPKPDAARLAWRDDLHRAYLALTEVREAHAAGAVNLAGVTGTLEELLAPDDVWITDGGSFARWIHRYHRCRAPRTFLGPVSGAMGYAVPGAIGASLARPDARVVAFVGDGGFNMTGQELITALESSIPIKVLVCDNAAHGSILYSQHQRYGPGSEYATLLRSPDFAAVARAYGVPAWRVEETGAFAGAMKEALAHEGPALIHLLTDRRDIVPGQSDNDAV